MKTIRTLVTTLLLTFAVTTVSAQQGATVTVNGETLEQQVVSITFDGDNAVLHFADGAQLSADMQTLVLLFPKGTETVIQVLSQPVGDTFRLEGLPAGTPVSVYDAKGRQVLATVVPLVSVSSLRSGTYLLKAGAHVVKFVKR